MLRRNWSYCIVLLAGLLEGISIADELATTRAVMKRQLQALKNRESRLPLPPITEEDRTSGRMLVNNGRLRSLYLPPTWQSFLVPGWGSGSRQPPAGGTASLLKALEADPSYTSKTRLFWIVSRTNNCQYCLGHQELKLKRVGMTDGQIAQLDCHWDSFSSPEQTAMRTSRKLTITPHLFGDQEIPDLKRQYKDAEIIDILYTVARYNAVNRWTAASGIPQDQSFGGEEPCRAAETTFSDAEVAEIIQVICDANAFDRFTEALSLPLEI